jgi:hypothetical protein
MTTDAAALQVPLRIGATAEIAHHVAPVASVIVAVIVIWYAAAVWLNAPQVIDRFTRDEKVWTARALASATWSMERPVLPAPHQIAANFYETVFKTAIDSKRSLVYHAGVTISATLLGFVFGSVLGIVLRSESCTRACSTAAFCPGSSRPKPYRSWRLRRWSWWCWAAWALWGCCPRPSSPCICASSQ